MVLMVKIGFYNYYFFNKFEKAQIEIPKGIPLIQAVISTFSNTAEVKYRSNKQLYKWMNPIITKEVIKP